jgi:outer membrane protein TolC
MTVMSKWLAVAVLMVVCLGWGEGVASSPGGSREGARVPRESRAGAAEKPETVTLDQLVEEALSRSPSIEAASRAAQARRVRIPAETTLPDPVVSFQNMGDLNPPSLQAGDPSSGRFYGIEQEIPFPGKLALKGKLAASETEAEEWSAEEVRRQVVADLKEAYYEYGLVLKSLEIVEKDRKLLETMTEVAQSRYAVGEGSQQDVLRAQVELSRLQDRLAELEQRRASVVALINKLVYRPDDSPLGKPVFPENSQLALKEEEMVRLAMDQAASLQKQDRQVERSEHAVELARKEYYPDFALGFTYVDRRSDPEMYGLMVKAKVPLYFWRKQRLDLESARLSLSATRKQRESEASSVTYAVRNAHAAALSAQKLAQLYGTTIVPQARLTFEASLASYQVGDSDFRMLMESLSALLEYELKQYEALAELHKAVARLELFTGPLTPPRDF